MGSWAGIYRLFLSLPAHAAKQQVTCETKDDIPTSSYRSGTLLLPRNCLMLEASSTLSGPWLKGVLPTISEWRGRLINTNSDRPQNYESIL